MVQIRTVPFQFRSQAAVEHDKTLPFEKWLQQSQLKPHIPLPCSRFQNTPGTAYSPEPWHWDHAFSGVAGAKPMRIARGKSPRIIPACVKLRGNISYGKLPSNSGLYCVLREPGHAGFSFTRDFLHHLPSSTQIPGNSCKIRV